MTDYKLYPNLPSAPPENPQVDIVTCATAVFDRVISGALKDGIIDEEEFNTL